MYGPRCADVSPGWRARLAGAEQVVRAPLLEAHRMSTTWKPVADPQTSKANLPDSAFAFPKQRKEPLIDAPHVRNALARFAQVQDVSDEERAQAFDNIRAAAKHFDVHVGESSWHDLMR